VPSSRQERSGTMMLPAVMALSRAPQLPNTIMFREPVMWATSSAVQTARDAPMPVLNRPVPG
jgi:hypothetical protein